MKKALFLTLSFAVLYGFGSVRAAETAAEILEKSQQAYFYPGADTKARIAMELVAPGGKKRTRALVLLRKNIPGGKDQKYYLYFQEPADVRKTAFLVWKYPGKDDDRWIFIPSLSMVRRVAASDSRSSFVGSDFTYEDVSGRDLDLDTHALLREEKLGDADTYVIESRPKQPTDFTRKLTWVAKMNYLPLKEEYYDEQNQLSRQFTADRVEGIAAGGKQIPTVTKRTMQNLLAGTKTETTFSGVQYDLGLDDSVFTERALQSPPLKWLQ